MVALSWVKELIVDIFDRKIKVSPVIQAILADKQYSYLNLTKVKKSQSDSLECCLQYTRVKNKIC